MPSPQAYSLWRRPYRPVVAMRPIDASRVPFPCDTVSVRWRLRLRSQRGVREPMASAWRNGPPIDMASERFDGAGVGCVMRWMGFQPKGGIPGAPSKGRPESVVETVTGGRCGFRRGVEPL